MGRVKVMKARAATAKFTIKYDSTQATPGVVGKYYPADDVKVQKGPTPVRNAPKLKASIKPGSVLILVAGRFRGKRVVCLKQLGSGLLLVSGPYEVNGVPLRRVNQKYCIATSTSVDVSGVDVSKINDDFFKRVKGESDAKETVTQKSRKDAQVKVDAALMGSIKKVDMLDAYLKAKFTLSRADRPHAMKF
jgi:large subunit ribosomal protein L6e